MFKDKKIGDFIDKLASSEPVPGGGSVSAIVGSISAALLEMVISLTVDRKKYMDVNDEMKANLTKITALRKELLSLSDEDAKVYNKVMDAYRLKKETEKEKELRLKEIDKALHGAALIPLKIAKTLIEAFEYTKFVYDKGNVNAQSDALVAAVMFRSSVFSALYNVEINIKFLKDRAVVKELQKEVDLIKEKAIKLESEIIND